MNVEQILQLPALERSAALFALGDSERCQAGRLLADVPGIPLTHAEHVCLLRYHRDRLSEQIRSTGCCGERVEPWICPLGGKCQVLIRAEQMLEDQRPLTDGVYRDGKATDWDDEG